MINSKYIIDLSHGMSDGGYSALFRIKDQPLLGFKEFISKPRAIYSRKIQLKLSKLDLAPKIYSKICKMKYHKLFPDQITGWGYLTEIARPIDKRGIVSPKRIQDLVDEIFSRTRLKFWDCHLSNIGLVKRKKQNKLVCIDTGKESFDGYANAWGNPDPGPLCSYCLDYYCNCED
jgi:hypothetical protein